MADYQSPQASDRIPTSAYIGTIIVFLLALGVYTITVRPQIGPSLDSIELHLATMTRGIVHPPGSPQYTALAWAAAHILPGPDAAYRINLFDALCMALTVALINLLTFRLTRHNIISALAAMSLAIAPRMWYLGSVAELYALNSLYIAGVLYLLVTWYQTRHDVLYWGAVIVYAMSFGNHTSMILLLPAFLFGVLIANPHMLFRPINLALTALIVLIAASQYAQIPIRMSANPQYCNFCTEMHTPRDFIAFVTGGPFKHSFFTVGKRDMIMRISESIQQFSIQFMPWGLVLGVIGLWEMARRQWKMAALLFIGLFCEWFFVMGYNIPDWHDFLSPSYVIFTPMIGYGMMRVWQVLSAQLAPMASGWQARAFPMARQILGPALAGISALALVVLALTYYPNVDGNSKTDWEANAHTLMAYADHDESLLLMPYTFSAAYTYSYAIPYYAFMDKDITFHAVPPYDLKGLPLGAKPTYVPWPEVAPNLTARKLVEASQAGTIPRYFLIDPSESRFKHMGMLPVCATSSDIIAGYEVVAVQHNGEITTLVSADRWNQVKEWVVFQDETAICPPSDAVNTTVLP